jgi:hypothetical protein
MPRNHTGLPPLPESFRPLFWDVEFQPAALLDRLR